MQLVSFRLISPKRKKESVEKRDPEAQDLSGTRGMLQNPEQAAKQLRLAGMVAKG